MQELIEELATIKRDYQQQLANYSSLTASMQAQVQVQAGQTMRHMKELLTILHENQKDPRSTQAMQIYQENMQLLQQFTHLNTDDTRLSTGFQVLSVPQQQVQPVATDFAGNLRSLKEQLISIHALLNQTSEQANISAAQELERQQTSDVSRMAVQQIRATLKTENKMLSADVQQLREDLKQCQQENRELKRRLADQMQIADEARALQEGTKENLDTLNLQYERVKGERDQYQQQLENMTIKYQRSTQELKSRVAELESAQEKKFNDMISLQTENEILRTKVKNLNAEIAKYKQQNVDSANIELEKAQQLITQLQQRVIGLSQDINKQKVAYGETIENLKTTIAALHEELFEEDGGSDVTKLPRAILEQKIVQIHDENQGLQAKVQELERRVSEAESARPCARRPESAVDAILRNYGASQQLIARSSRDPADEDLEKIIQQGQSGRATE